MRYPPRLLPVCFTLTMSSAAIGHVKWFSDYEETMTPVTWYELFSLSIIGVLIVSSGAVFAAISVHNSQYIQSMKIHLLPRHWRVDDVQQHILQIGLAISIALCWKANVILAPELSGEAANISLLQFAIITSCFIPKLKFLLPIGIAILFVVGITTYGFVHMIDYLYFIGVIWFLALHFSSTKASNAHRLGMSGIYFLTGFSLCWVGIEKLVYPHWTAQIAIANPNLTFGFPTELFTVIAAAVEFTFDYFFMMQRWTKTCAAVLSVVMLLTTLQFGMREILGHTPLHSILIIMLLDEPLTKSSSNSNRQADQRINSLAFSLIYLLVFLGFILLYYVAAIYPSG